MDTRRRMAKAAAVLTAHFGATKQQLVQDVRTLARHGQGGLSGGEVGGIVRGALRSQYVTLSRFQDLPAHNQPHAPAPAGLEMAQQWGRSVAGSGRQSTLLAMPREGADHTQGANQSRFVSLTGDPQGLHDSPDPWARDITRGADQLHDYTIPRRLVRDSTRLVQDIGLSRRVAHAQTPWYNLFQHVRNWASTRGDTGRTEWLEGTPTEENEVLYMGSDLDKYRTRQRPNPYKA